MMFIELPPPRPPEHRCSGNADQKKQDGENPQGESWPGQSMPSPAPVQNTPKADNMTPTPNFRVFSGTFERLADGDADGEDDKARRQRPDPGGPQKAAPGAHGDHDQHDSSPSSRTALKAVRPAIQSSEVG